MGTPRQYVACNLELKRLFMAPQVPEGEVDEVAKALFTEVGVETVHHFLGYFAQIPIIDLAWPSRLGDQGRIASVPEIVSDGPARCRDKHQGKGEVYARPDAEQPNRPTD